MVVVAVATPVEPRTIVFRLPAAVEYKNIEACNVLHRPDGSNSCKLFSSNKLHIYSLSMKTDLSYTKLQYIRNSKTVYYGAVILQDYVTSISPYLKLDVLGHF